MSGGMRVGDERRFSHVDLQGTGGPLLVALPSGPGFSGRTLSAWLGGLAMDRRVGTVELPGCGRGSLEPGLDYGFASYVADLEAVRSTLGAGTLALLGHGWGAAMAVEYALAHPGRVERLVLVNPLRIFTGAGQDSEAQGRMVARIRPALFDEWMRDVAPAFQAAQANEISWEVVEANPWWGRMVLTQFAQPAPAKWHDVMRDEAWRLRAYTAYKGAAMFDPGSAMAQYDLAERTSALSMPVLILACDDDANYVAPPERHAVPLGEKLAQARLVVWKGVGHFPFVEREDAFADLTHDFLSSGCAIEGIQFRPCPIAGPVQETIYEPGN